MRLFWGKRASRRRGAMNGAIEVPCPLAMMLVKCPQKGFGNGLVVCENQVLHPAAVLDPIF